MGKIPEEIQKFLKEGRLAYVATVGPNNEPHVVPKGSLDLLDEMHLIYAELREGQTFRNIQHNPKISVAVVNPLAYRGYEFVGTAEIISRGPEFDMVAYRVATQFSNYSKAKHAVKIKVLYIVDLSMGKDKDKIIPVASDRGAAGEKS